ncbi:MAG TPA: DsbA family oxidoreductase [Flavobacterium sp.]|jgi:predicted DsbA family dithiol-disulfide isomerase
MTIEIYSDIVCPFCYIGKTKFEKALAQFEGKENVEIIWRAYQLNPDAKTDPSVTSLEHFCKIKGVSPDEGKNMYDNVTRIAKESGLVFNLYNAVPANTFRAHQFSAFAKSKGIQNEVEAALFAAYFTEGKNIDAITTFIEIGQKYNIPATDIEAIFDNNAFADEVDADIERAHEFGINAVLFFIFDNKYAVKGAQSTEHFLEVLKKCV